MPLYVYECKECKTKVEMLQAFNDPKPDCNKCSSSMKKKIVATNFSLKGSGWARDNYGLK
tara:strand:- start:10770 stop:10949 length:180 start_codon:yes stop_codon:yes gene_type:complete